MRRVSSTCGRRMFWKSTAILVHATSRPRTGFGSSPIPGVRGQDVRSRELRCLIGRQGRHPTSFLPRDCRGFWQGGRQVATTHDTVHGQYFPQSRAGFWHSPEGKQANVLSTLGFNPYDRVKQATYRAQRPGILSARRKSANVHGRLVTNGSCAVTLLHAARFGLALHQQPAISTGVARRLLRRTYEARGQCGFRNEQSSSGRGAQPYRSVIGLLLPFLQRA